MLTSYFSDWQSHLSPKKWTFSLKTTCITLLRMCRDRWNGATPQLKTHVKSSVELRTWAIYAIWSACCSSFTWSRNLGTSYCEQMMGVEMSLKKYHTRATSIWLTITYCTSSKNYLASWSRLREVTSIRLSSVTHIKISKEIQQTPPFNAMRKSS